MECYFYYYPDCSVNCSVSKSQSLLAIYFPCDGMVLNATKISLKARRYVNELFYIIGCYLLYFVVGKVGLSLKYESLLFFAEFWVFLKTFGKILFLSKLNDCNYLKFGKGWSWIFDFFNRLASRRKGNCLGSLMKVVIKNRMLNNFTQKSWIRK